MSQNHSFELPAFLRAFLLILSAAACTAILGPPALVSCLLDRSGRWPSFFQGLWVGWLLKSNGVHLRLEGAENLKKDQSYILVSNHTSLLDIPGMIAAAPFPVRFMAKKSLLWFPIFGWVLYAAGHILIDRERATSGLKSLKEASSLLKKGISIIVFPEGTRSPDGEVKGFKRGAFLLAQHSGFPVVPVSISGTDEMLPRHGWCFWPGTIQVHVGAPIFTRDLSHQESRDLMRRVRDMIIRDLRAARAERDWTGEGEGERPEEGLQESRC